jgi:hypothetical protein
MIELIKLITDLILQKTYHEKQFTNLQIELNISQIFLLENPIQIIKD